MIKIANFPFKDLLKTLSDGSRAVKVQQSGSNVSDVILRSQIIPANSQVECEYIMKNTKLAIGVRWTETPSEWVINMYDSLDDGFDQAIRSEDLLISTDTWEAVKDEPFSKYCKIRIKNNDEVDRLLRAVSITDLI